MMINVLNTPQEDRSDDQLTRWSISDPGELIVEENDHLYLRYMWINIDLR